MRKQILIVLLAVMLAALFVACKNDPQVVEYTITFDKNNEAAVGKMDPQKAVEKTDVTLPENKFILANYGFGGWNTKKDGTGTAYADKGKIEKISADITLYAQWKGDVYKVTLTTNGGTIAEGKDVTSYTYGVGATLPVAADITKDNYGFGGWFDNEQCTGDAVTAIPATATGAKTFYAKWTADTYAVTLTTNGGTIAEGKNVTSYTYGVGATLPVAADITKDNYTFGGWFDNEQCTGEAVTAIPDTATGAKTFYAKWTADTYKVTLTTNGGTIAEGKNVTSYTYGVGATLPVAADITKTCYVFKGWFDNEKCTGEAVTAISKTDTGDKTFYAKWVDELAGTAWVDDKYGIIVISDESSHVYLSMLGLGTEKNDYSLCVQDNTKYVVTDGEQIKYEFSGNNLILYLQMAEPPAPATAVTFVPGGDTCTITFDNNETGEEHATETQIVLKGTDMPLLYDAFTKEGNLLWWTTGKEGKGTAYLNGASINCTADTILYANWVEAPFSSNWVGKDATKDIHIYFTNEEGISKVKLTFMIEGNPFDTDFAPYEFIIHDGKPCISITAYSTTFICAFSFEGSTLSVDLSPFNAIPGLPENFFSTSELFTKQLN